MIPPATPGAYQSGRGIRVAARRQVCGAQGVFVNGGKVCSTARKGLLQATLLAAPGWHRVCGNTRRMALVRLFVCFGAKSKILKVIGEKITSNKQNPRGYLGGSGGQ